MQLFAYVKAGGININAVDAQLEEQVHKQAKFGWSIETLLQADINGDNNNDAAVVLKDNNEHKNKEDDPGNRRLIILINRIDGKFEQVGFSDKILLCANCYGALAGSEGGSPQIDISPKGIINIRQQWGSRELSDVTLHFRYAVDEKRILLIGKDINYSDRATGAVTKTSVNYLTGSVIEKKYQYNEKSNKEELLAAIQKNIKKQHRFIEDAVIDTNF